MANNYRADRPIAGIRRAYGAVAPRPAADVAYGAAVDRAADVGRLRAALAGHLAECHRGGRPIYRCRRCQALLSQAGAAARPAAW